MVTVTALLALLEQRGVSLTLDPDNRLITRSPGGAITPTSPSSYVNTSTV